MPLRIGLLAYPVFLFILVMARKGVVGKFARARAFSPDTARRPGSLGIEHLDQVHDAVKAGRLVATEGGRYYVDMARYVRLRRWLMVLVIAFGILMAAITVWIFLAE